MDDRMALRDRAVALARKGFRVFPLVPNGKVPALDSDWKVLASNSCDRVHRLWSEALSGDPLDYNIGIATGAGFFVLDVDNKKGKHGATTLERLEIRNDDLPLTFTVRSPNHGEHRYFLAKDVEWIANSGSKLGEGIDIKGDNGYVVAPGSVIDGKAYEVACDESMTEAPQWLKQAVVSRRPEAATTAPAIDLDLPEAVAAATKWLQRHAEIAIEGAGGDATTIRVANRVLDHGISVDQALDLMLDHWNDRCSPPWDADELRRKVENAERYRQSPVGASSAELEFDDVSDEVTQTEMLGPDPSKARPADAWAFQTADEADRGALTATHRPLVRDYLDCGAMSLLYGAPGQAKTFSAIYLAYCVASGQPWAGNRVTQGLVFYLVAEGGGGFRKRVRALKQVYGFDADLPLVFLPLSVDLRNPNDVKGLARTIRAAEERFGQKCVLTIIDTVSRVLAGGDENSSTDMGGLIKNFDKIRETIGCHLMAIHHTGKDDSRGARGWSGLKAALDTELEVKDGAVTVKKQRDLEFAEPIVFHLEGAEIGRGPEGEAVTSAVVRIGEKPKPVEATEEFEACETWPAGKGPTELEDRLLTALAAAGRKRFGEKFKKGAIEFAVSTSEWDESMAEIEAKLPLTALTGSTAWSTRTKQRRATARQQLVNKFDVQRTKGNQWFR